MLLLTLLWRVLRAGWMFTGILAEYLVLVGLRRVRGPGSFESYGNSVHRRCARRLRRGALRLGGVYIKSGQAVSIMTSFLPPAYLEELESLQDSVPPHPYPEIRKRVEAELGEPVESLFASFDAVPVASASLGQVHLAVTHEGEAVAVKVQYPGLERIVRVDLWVIRQVLRVVGSFLPHAHYERVHADLSAMIHRELDYVHEGKNCERIAANFCGDPHTEFPEIHWKLSTDRVLTMQRLYGRKITDVAGIRADGLEPEIVVRTLVNAFFKQLLVDRVFHADPHPGNFLVHPGADGLPVVAFLDFGAVEEIGPELRDGMRQVVLGYFRKDPDLVVSGMRTMGFQSEVGDDAVFEQAVRFYFDKVLHLDVTDMRHLDLGQFNVISNVKEMQLTFRELSRSFQIPLRWFYVERTLLLGMQLCALVAPSVNPVEIGLPYAMQFIVGGEEATA